MVVMEKITCEIHKFLGFSYFCYNIISGFFFQGISVFKNEEKINKMTIQAY
mgnify:CR=1 FL=1